MRHLGVGGVSELTQPAKTTISQPTQAITDDLLDSSIDLGATTDKDTLLDDASKKQ